jgi:oligopeptide/dipeptide ABC transporter ATP-binding protein
VTSTNNTFLSVKDLKVEYRSGKSIVHAVNGVSFDLARGKTLGLVGETGAGKTTTAKTIMRILPEFTARVAGGEIILDGEDLLSLSEKDMRKIRGEKVSMIFQDPMTALNPLMTVGEQIAEAVRLHNEVSRVDAQRRAVEMLEMVGIPSERFKQFPHEFSGGMKQRVVIAEALACNPELLIADEPTTALDVTIQAQVLEMIRNLRDRLNTAMIMITHNLGVVAEVCDDVAVIYAGEIIEQGSKRDIFKHAAHPYTLGLFASLPSMAVASKRLQPIEGLMPDPSNLPDGCRFNPRCPHATDECRTESVRLTEVAPGHLCRCLRAKLPEE